MPRRRDESGLTELQRQSLPHIAEAQSLRAGALKIVELGIISSVEYWYKEWWKQDAYIAAVKNARAEVFGEIRERTLAKLQAFHDDVTNSLIAGAMRPGAGQLGFIRLYLEMEGFLAGNPLLPTSPPNNQWGGMSDNGRLALPERLAKHLTARNALVRELRAARPDGQEISVQGTKSNGGDGNGRGGNGGVDTH